MKTKPKTKHSKQFINDKAKLIAKTVLNNKLRAIEAKLLEYIAENPIDIDCKDVSKSAAYTIFISVSDGKNRAYVAHASASEFDIAFKDLISKVSAMCEKNSINPLWIKADIVNHVERTEFSTLKDRFLKLKYPQFFRMGFSLDYKMSIAFLESEANAYKIYDYSVIPLSTSKPDHDKVPCINLVQMKKYLKRYGVEEEPMLLPFVYFFTCKSFLLDSDNSFYELYSEGTRCGRRKMDDLSGEFVKNIITSSSRYLTKQIKEDNRFIYGYMPCFNATLTSYNILRHAGTAWSMLCAYDVTKDDSLLETINASLYYMLSQITYMDDDTAFLVEEKSNEIKLGGNGIAIIMIAKYIESFGEHNFKDIIRKLANGILYLQDKETGKLTHVLNADDFSLKEEFRTVYYDGESSYALVKAYEITEDKEYLDGAKLSIDYFISNNYVKYRDHWLAYAMNEFTQHVKEDKYLEFALKNAWENRTVILKQETSYHTYLELLMETYEIYLRLKNEGTELEYFKSIDEREFVDVIKHRAIHMLDGYFFPEYAMYMSKPETVLGSFFVRHDEFRDRIDDNQHFIDGYAKYYKVFCI